MELSACICLSTCGITPNYLNSCSWASSYDVCLRFLWWSRAYAIYLSTSFCYSMISYIKCYLILSRKILLRKLFRQIWTLGWNRKNRTEVSKKMSKHLGCLGHYFSKVSSTFQSFSPIYCRINGFY